MSYKRNLLVLLIPVILLGISILFSSLFSAQAAPTTTTYTVCASGCNFSRIQDAINAAAQGDTIRLAGETFTESITINKSLDIEGTGSENTIIQADESPGFASNRVVTIAENTTVNISDVTIRYGVALEGRGGGGVLNAGSLTIENSTINSNTANIGGGITNQKFMTITNCIVDQNYASSWGGGIFLDNSSSNTPDLTAITIQNSVISNNTANHSVSGSGGGGLFSYNSTVNLSKTTVIGNHVNGASQKGGGIHIYYRSVAEITDSIITGNTADRGAGIYNEFESQLDIQGTAITNNIAGRPGGGIYNEEESTIHIYDCTISENTSTTGGGGIYNYDESTIIISGSLISNNRVIGAYSGGGIFNMVYSSVSIVNSTFSQNSAGSYGGGIDNSYYSVVSTQQVTFEGNRATDGGSDIASRHGTLTQPSVIYLEASILSGDISSGNCYRETGTAEAYVVDKGYNIVDDGSCLTAGTSFTADPKLGLLQDNGGDTNTHELLNGSPAIDAIPEGSCDLGIDQRGALRPQGSGCDIGAFEVGFLPPSNFVFLPIVTNQ
jgi:hypothetical protein